MDIITDITSIPLPILISGNISYALLFISWFFERAHVIRAISILGWTLIIIYLILSSSNAVIPLLWNTLFISINLYKLIMYWIRNKKNQLTEFESYVYNLVFKNFEIPEFKELLSFSEFVKVPNNTKKSLIKASHKPKYLYLITKGQARVRTENGLEIIVESGAFQGEMSFIDSSTPYASVDALPNCEYLKWNQAQLSIFFKTHKDIKNKFFSLFLKDIIRKLRKSSLS